MGIPALLTTAALTKRFSLAGEEIVALDSIALDIRAGDFLAIMGPSGSGKTTLLTLLGGLDRPTEGALHWRGQPFSELPERALVHLRCKEIGFVFQDACLMSGLDALNNVRLPQLLAGSTNSIDHATDLLHRMGLDARLHHLPGQLSRGEQQRVAVARALANQPTILLADEPTGNLDRAATRRMFATFKEINENDQLTCVVATHDEAVLEYATRWIVLADGRIVDADAGPPAGARQ